MGLVAVGARLVVLRGEGAAQGCCGCAGGAGRASTAEKTLDAAGVGAFAQAQVWGLGVLQLSDWPSGARTVFCACLGVSFFTLDGGRWGGDGFVVGGRLATSVPFYAPGDTRLVSWIGCASLLKR